MRSPSNLKVPGSNPMRGGVYSDICFRTFNGFLFLSHMYIRTIHKVSFLSLKKIQTCGIIARIDSHRIFANIHSRSVHINVTITAQIFVVCRY